MMLWTLHEKRYTALCEFSLHFDTIDSVITRSFFFKFLKVASHNSVLICTYRCVFAWNHICVLPWPLQCCRQTDVWLRLFYNVTASSLSSFARLHLLNTFLYYSDTRNGLPEEFDTAIIHVNPKFKNAGHWIKYFWLDFDWTLCHHCWR